MGRSTQVLGPYVEGARFRLCVQQGKRRLKSIWCHSREEAERIKQRMEEALTEAGAQTLGDAIDDYLADQLRQGLAPGSLRTLGYRLRAFLPATMSLGAMTEKLAQRLYKQETERTGRRGAMISAATHRATLKAARIFFRWVVAQGQLSRNPFDAVTPIGRVNSGKRQLTIDEARCLGDFLFLRAAADDEGATAVLLQLLLGLRSSEVLNRRVRDVTDDAAELFIERGKTRHARRRLEIHSEPLRALLRRQMTGRAPHELLFGSGRSQPRASDYLWHRLRGYCAQAGVPIVCPHSLRGLHSTIAMEKGATSSLVAAALGHGSFAVTARHYVDQSTLINIQLRRVQDALSPADADEKPARVEVEKVSALLRGLPLETLDAILHSVGARR